MTDVLCREDDPRVGELRARLDRFYRTTAEYTAFQAVNRMPDFWDPIREDIRRIVDRRRAAGPDAGKCRVLEFGAGTSAFGEFLGPIREHVELEAQDVTAQNADTLRKYFDRVYVGDVLELPGPYDVIFSTFVWEHITNPRRVLDHLLGILRPGGSLFLASPRYDLPGYIPPTARHYGPLRLSLMMARLHLRRLAVRLGATPGFFIHLDPAMFHRPWYRDADAVHWVSLHDLRRALPRGFTLGELRTPAPSSVKGWLWRKFCVLSVRIHKSESVATPPGAQTA